MTSRKDASDSASLLKDDLEVNEHRTYEYEDGKQAKEGVKNAIHTLEDLDLPAEADTLSLSPDDLPKDALTALVTDPDNALSHIVNAARHLGYDDARIVGELPRVDGDRRHKRIEDLRANDIGTLVSIDCKVTDRTDQYSEVRKAIYICDGCGERFPVLQDHLPGDLNDVGYCGGSDCGTKPKYEREHNKEVSIDAQQLILQDLHILTSRSTPADITGTVYNGLVDVAETGSDITITAIVRSQPRDGFDPEQKANELKLHVVGVEHHDEDYAGIELTDKDVEHIEELARDPHVYEILSGSIAPKIKGDYSLAKSAALYQLFGCIDHSTPDSPYRSDIHTGFVGDPGGGKSDIAKYTAKIAPTSVYQSGDGASKVGITAAVTREHNFDSSEWTLSGGALVRADGGHCVLDELDKAPPEVQGSLQEPLSEQEVSVSKADISATLPTRCSVMLVANPKGERFDEFSSLAEQIDVNPAIWDRLDVIVPFQDVPDEEQDAEIADAILDFASGDDGEYVPPETMTKYISYARRIDPELTTEARESIREAYIELRNSGSSGRVPVGPRQLNSFIRLAEASARIRLSETVDEEDAERSEDLMKGWMNALMTDEHGNLDVGALGGKTYTQRERIAFMWEQFEDLSGDEGVERDTLVQVLMDAGIERKTVQQTINKFIGNGNLIQEEGMLYDGR